MRFLFFILLLVSYNANAQTEAYFRALLKKTQTPPPPPTGYLTFLSDFIAHPQVGGFQHNIATAGRIVNDPSKTTWHGEPATSVSIRPGDNAVCDASCNRNENVEMVDIHNGNIIIEDSMQGKTVYYGFSIFIPAAYITTSPEWELVWEIHGPDDYAPANPIFSIYPTQFQLERNWSFNYNTGNINGARTNGRTLMNFNGASPALNLDHWTDFIMEVFYAPKGIQTGTCRIYRRDEGAVNFTKVIELTNIFAYQTSSTLDPVANNFHYWLQGLYRAASPNTDQIWVGPSVRASTWSLCQVTAFNTNVIQP